jgi:cation transport ATPase
MQLDINKRPLEASQPSSTPAEFSKRARAQLIWATLLTLALYFIPYANLVLYPLRLFVTFIHESGHALATVASGGSVASIQIMPNGAGLTMSAISPWWIWLVSSGGYLGTALFGAIMLQIGRVRSQNSPGRAALYAMGVTSAVITLLWCIRLNDPFSLFTGAGITAVLFSLGRFLPAKAANFTAMFLAVQCSLNALGDIAILLHLTTMGSEHNDAANMEKSYLLPAPFWATLWAGIACIMLFLSLRSYWRATSKNAEVQPLGAVKRV